MKAIQIAQHGGPEVLTLVDLPDLPPGPGEVAVQIRAASVNAADWKVRRGSSTASVTLPHVPGRDFAGTVVAVGEGADLAVGTDVFGVCPRETEGGYASRIVLPADLVAPMPAGFSHVESAAIALAGLTAMISLQDTLHLQAGEKILVQGGAGGVGGMAVQLARYMGAHVVTTGRAVNRDYPLGLGAHEVLDYTTQDIGAALGDCDAAFDTVGTATVPGSFAALRPGGRAAFIASGTAAPEPPRTDVTALRPAVNRSRALMARVAALAELGVFKPPVIETMPLADAARAHVASEAGHVRGKLVLLPD